MPSRMIRARSSSPVARGGSAKTRSRKLSLESLEARSLLAGIEFLDIAAALIDDSYENNDTRQTARNLGTLSSSQTVNNLVQADANDWYRFTTTRTGSAASNVSISSVHAQGDLDLELYNSAGARLRVSQGITGTETVSLASLAAGTYYVRVYGYRGVTNPRYSLSVNLGSSVLVDDAYENNDTLSTASNLGTLTANANVTNLSLADTADWFRFTTTATGSTSSIVAISFQNAQGNLALQLYNSAGTLVGTSNGSGNVEGVSLSGRAAGTYYARVYSATGATNPAYALQIVAPVVATTTTTTTPTTTGAFDIQIVYSGFTASQRAIFEQAVTRWESIIVGDLPNATYNGVVVDDLMIHASSSAIDGVGGTLGQAGYDRARTSGTRLPYHGMMEFDSADLASMEASGTLYNVILHEIAHVFGLGTMWQARGLVTGAGTSNPLYVGTQGLAAYRAIFGNNATGVPLENGGGSGTRDAHWRESSFNNEIMTGYINSGSNPISRITVAALADLGYSVNMTRADAYTRPASVTVGTATTSTASSSTANLLLADEAAGAASPFNAGQGFIGCLCRSCTGAPPAVQAVPARVNAQAAPLVPTWNSAPPTSSETVLETERADDDGRSLRRGLADVIELLFAGEDDWSCVARA